MSGVVRDVAYCSDSGEIQRLDLYWPTASTTGPRPVVLYIHGGTWIAGSKDDATRDPVVPMLRAHGFIVASMDYALAPQHPFPAQIQDLTCGVRFLRARHAAYGIDPAHIGALGVSAGGHLSAMLGVDNGSHMFVSGGYPYASSAVQSVAALYGVHDLPLRDLAGYDERVLPEIFGPVRRWGSESPITYVRSRLPPFLLIHGDRDTDVPILQSRVMANKLKAARDDVTFTVVHHAEHGLVPSGGKMSPSLKTIDREIVAFFARTLEPGSPDAAAASDGVGPWTVNADGTSVGTDAPP